METFFNIRFEFDPAEVQNAIDRRLKQQGADYICVCDGVIMNTANRVKGYMEVINGGMFSICDSSFIPLYLKKIYGKKYEQYCGTSILNDLVATGKYRMMFLGANAEVLTKLKNKLSVANPEVNGMKFVELPYCRVSQFDYEGIAEVVRDDNPDIIWVSLGAPKQELFMAQLRPHLERGVMIAVGAAFNFCIGEKIKRAPRWMINHHLEFLYRLKQEPGKQSKRCFNIVRTLPGILYKEWRRARKKRTY